MVKDFAFDFRLVCAAAVFYGLSWPGTGGEPMNRADVRVKGCWKRATTRSAGEVESWHIQIPQRFSLIQDLQSSQAPSSHF